MINSVGMPASIFLVYSSYTRQIPLYVWKMELLFKVLIIVQQVVDQSAVNLSFNYDISCFQMPSDLSLSLVQNQWQMRYSIKHTSTCKVQHECF